MSWCSNDWKMSSVFFRIIWIINFTCFYIADHLAEASSPCSREIFTCVYSKECIKLQYICDGMQDCEDNTDEEHCPEVTQTHPRNKRGGKAKKPQKKKKQEEPPKPGDPDWMCPYNLFTCKNKECIARDLECDGTPHCSDKSDEEICLRERQREETSGQEEEIGEDFECPHGLFTCKNKECVVPTERCNGTSLCSDGSDEWDCKKIKKSSSSSSTKGKVKKGQSKVAAKAKKKNYNGGCQGSEEKKKTNTKEASSKENKNQRRKKESRNNYHGDKPNSNQRTRGDTVSMCKNSRQKTKDGERQQQNHQFAFKNFFQCASGMISCDNGQCIAEKKRCNGHRECQDGSDEKECVIVSERVKMGATTTKARSCRVNSGSGEDCIKQHHQGNRKNKTVPSDRGRYGRRRKGSEETLTTKDGLSKDDLSNGLNEGRQVNNDYDDDSSSSKADLLEGEVEECNGATDCRKNNKLKGLSDKQADKYSRSSDYKGNKARQEDLLDVEEDVVKDEL